MQLRKRERRDRHGRDCGSRWVRCRGQRRGKSQRSQRLLSGEGNWENGSAIYTNGEVRRRSKFKEEKFNLRNIEFEMMGESSVF